MALNSVTLTGNLGVAAAKALAVFTPSNWLPAPADSQLLPPAPVAVTLSATGSFSVSLTATDNADLPAGWTWTVAISGIGGVAQYSFSFPLPFASGATQDISALAHVTPASLPAYLPLPSGTPQAGQVPVATGTGEASAWGTAAGLYVPVNAPLPSGVTSGAADTAALNSALAALSAGEALILTVPGYWISAPLSVPSGCGLISLTGAGASSGFTPDIKVAAGFSGGAMIANAGWLGNSRTGDDGIEISGLYIDGGNGGSTGPFVPANGHGIVLSAAHSRIHGNYVKNVSGAGIVWADFNSAGQSVNAGVTQENYCYGNKVSNPGQWGIWVSSTSGSAGMTDGVITQNIVTDPAFGSFYRNGSGLPQINPSNNFPYEAIRLDNGAGWWVTENHAYWCPGGAYFFGSLYGTHVLNNTCDSWGTFPWSLVGGAFTAGVINGMSLHKVKCDINVPPNITGRAIPSVVEGNVLNTLEGLNNNGIYAAGSGGSGNGCRFTFYDVTVDTLAVPAGATGQAAMVFAHNSAHQNSVGGQLVAGCTTTNGSATVTAAGGAFAGVQKGMSVTGTGIPASTYVGSAVTGGSDSLTLVQSDQATPQNATASGTVTLTFPAPYSLAEKWTGTAASTVLNARHASATATGSVVAAPAISTSNGAVINLLGALGGVTVSGVPSSGQVPTATGPATATWQTPSAGGSGYANLLIAPSGAIAETMPRNSAGTTKSVGTSGTIYGNAIPLFAGQVISNISLTVGATTGQTGGTHGWYVLLDSGLTVRAVTADQTGTAVWTTNTEIKLAVGTPYAVAATGLYFIGYCIVGTTTPTFIGGAAVGQVASIAPQMMGSLSAGQTTPPAVGTTLGGFSSAATTIANFYAYVS